MSRIKDRAEDGWLPLQDHREDVDASLHLGPGGVRIVADTDQSPGVWIAGEEDGLPTFADFRPYRFWQGSQERGFGSWSFAFPAESEGQGTGGGSSSTSGGQGANYGPGNQGVRPGSTATVRQSDGSYRVVERSNTVAPGEGPADLSVAARPIRKDDYLADPRYAQRSHVQPAHLSTYPRGFRGVGLAGTEETEQVDLFLPADGRLIAPHNAGPDRMGTLVCDLGPSGTLSRAGPWGVGGRAAPLQTHLHVVRLPAIEQLGNAAGNAAAFVGHLTEQGGMAGLGAYIGPMQEVTPASEGDKFVRRDKRGEVVTGNDSQVTGGAVHNGQVRQSDGTFIDVIPSNTVVAPGGQEIPDPDNPTPQGTPRQRKQGPNAVAFLDVSAGGTILSAPAGCPHQLGKTEDGQPIFSAHTHSDALISGPKGDAPLEFSEKPYPKAADYPLKSKVYLSYDPGSKHHWLDKELPGLHRWWTTVPYLTVDETPPTTPPTRDPEDDPPDDDIPPDEPRDPGDPPVVTPDPEDLPNVPGGRDPEDLPENPEPPTTGDPNDVGNGGPEPAYETPDPPVTGGGDQPTRDERPTTGGGSADRPGEIPWHPLGDDLPPGGIRGLPPGTRSDPFDSPDPFGDRPGPVTPRDLDRGGGRGATSGGSGSPDASSSGDSSDDSSPDSGQITADNSAQGSRVRSMIHHPLEEGFTSLTFLPQSMTPGRNDYRQPTAEFNENEIGRRPATLRAEAYAAEVDGEWDYEEEPGEDPINPGGTSVGGGVWLMRPSQHMDDFANDTEPSAPSGSGHYLGMADGTCLGFGSPSTSSGGMQPGGYTIARDSGEFVIGSDGDALVNVDADGTDYNASVNGTTGLVLPAGTTGERPGSPPAGLIRLNTTTGEVEADDGGGTWSAMPSGGGGGGDVTASANITDHALVRGDGGAKGVQETGILVDDSDNLTTPGLIDGRDVGVDGAKLDGIESGATADQTGAEIKAAYEAEPDTNAYDDAAVSKLAGIETGATGDQSDAEIKTAYENNANTNAFTDAEQTKLTGIETAADVTDEANVTDALDGATLSAVTVQASDKVLIQDVSNSDVLSTVTAQSIADLVSATIGSLVEGFMDARLVWKGTATIRLDPARGYLVEVAGEMVEIPSGGIVCTNADNLITSTGADAGAGPSASTLYYAYLSNADATFAPEDLRLSATAPTNFVNGIRYLASTGNGAKWRYVGMAYTDSSTQFEDSETARHVVSHYNRRRATVYLCPSYNDNNSATTYTKTNTSWASLGSVSFIQNYDDEGEAVEFSAFGRSYAASYWGNVGIGLNTGTAPSRAGQAALGGGLDSSVYSCRYDVTPSVGKNVAHLCNVVSGGTVTFYADLPRYGGSSDTPATYLTGQVMV